MADAGRPLSVRTEADGTSEYLRTRVADATNNSQLQTVDANGNAHVQPNGNNPASSPVTLKLSERGYSNADGIYDATNNTIPSTQANVVAVRNATPGSAQETIRQTGVNGSTETTVWAADVSLHQIATLNSSIASDDRPPFA